MYVGKVSLFESLEAENLADGDAMRISFLKFDGVAGLDHAFLQHAMVETAEAAVQKLFDYGRASHFVRKLEAWQAWHRNLDDGLATAQDITDADFCFQQARRGEVFAKGAGRIFWHVHDLFPVGIMLERIGVGGLMLAAVNR